LNRDAAFPTNPHDTEVLWITADPIAIANNVDMSGDGQCIAAGWWLNNERPSRYATISSGAQVWGYTENVNLFLPVSTSDNGDVIASCGSQVPLNVWLSGVGPNPSWSYAAPGSYHWADVDVSDNGAYIAAVCKWGGTVPAAKLYVFNANSPIPLWQANFSAPNGLNGVEISEDNHWIVVSSNSFFVFSLPAQALFFSGLNHLRAICGISADAEYLAEGDYYGALHLFRRIGDEYIEQWVDTLGGWATAVDVSSDGSKVIAGNFIALPSYAGLVRAYETSGTVLWTYDRYGDYVSSVALCNDGSVGVAGSWGQDCGTFGDVFTAFNMNTGSVIFQLLDDINEPGSIYSVAISDNGAYATAGGKAVHARTFGNGGEIYAIELTVPMPELNVFLTPINPPIVIPANGGSFCFDAGAERTLTPQVPFFVWARDRYPDGTYTSNLLGPVTINPPVGVTVSRQRTQVVPAGWPAGLHWYIGYANPAISYPSLDADSFSWTKSATADGGATVWEAANYGEPFPGEEIPPLSRGVRGDLVAAIPNPFNPTTAISYELRVASYTTLKVYDTTGRLVATLVKTFQEAGNYTATFDGTGFPSGIYFAEVTIAEQTSVKKMILMK
jgi:WD40 repeat protein